MPTPAYLSLEGTKQGLITAGTFTEDSVGNIFQEGHEDQVLVQGFDHQVIIPRDPQSGQPTGQRVHKPLMITKVFDKSSPLIFNALTSGERLSRCRLEWYRTSATGTQEHYFTIELQDAIIVAGGVPPLLSLVQCGSQLAQECAAHHDAAAVRGYLGPQVIR